jgi:hypothetical protein
LKSDVAQAQLAILYQELYAFVKTNLKITEEKAIVDFVHNVLDVAVQKMVEKMSWQLLKDPNATAETIGLAALVDFCIEGAIQKHLILSAPYKIFEDLMEGQTISTCEKLWDLLETRKEKLTGVSTTTTFCMIVRQSRK